jgi:hypothetical protein
MATLKKVALTAVIGLGLLTTAASADVAKGQKLYKKKLKSACGMSGADMAKKHTQAEWEDLKGNLKEEIKTICPKVKDKALKDKYMEHYYDFFHNFASDSGNVPSC